MEPISNGSMDDKITPIKKLGGATLPSDWAIKFHATFTEPQ